ncbi:MAG: nucleoside triphosphate pyrophosphatase [Alphaproteobacteria bacterium]
MGQPAAAPRLILASASPRRLDLLKQIGLIPDVVDPAFADESAKANELPSHHARRLALEKLRQVAPRHGGAFVLAADTVVACGRRILPKAEDEAETRACLELLSGRRHRVFGGVALGDPQGVERVRLVTTTVAFKRLTEAEIDRYLASGEWRGKAGGYAIQGRAAAFVQVLGGSYSNVVGLPLFETASLLEGAGYRPEAPA